VTRGIPAVDLEVTLPGSVVDELVDWRNMRGRAAVVMAPVRPRGRGTRVGPIVMRSDDVADLCAYLDWLVVAVAGLTPDQRRGVNMRPSMMVLARLRRLLDEAGR
jgi:hypothetical protein